MTKILQTEISENLKQKDEIKENSEKSIGLSSDFVLHRPVNSKQVKGLDQDVDQ